MPVPDAVAVLGGPGLVEALREAGLETVRTAEAVLSSARTGDTVRLAAAS